MDQESKDELHIRSLPERNTSAHLIPTSRYPGLVVISGDLSFAAYCKDLQYLPLS